MKVFSKILQFHSKATVSTQVLSCKLCEIFKNAYIAEYPRTTASAQTSLMLVIILLA